MTLTLNLSANQLAGLNLAAANANAAAKTVFDDAEQNHFKSDPTYVVQTYVPFSAEDYLTARNYDITDSYYKSLVDARQADPKNAAVLQDVLALPEDQFTQLVATVQGLVAQNSAPSA